MQSVYVETSIISYLAARPSRDLLVAAHQQVTHEWWQHRHRYELVVSELVVAEASRGEPSASARRLAVISGVKRLALSEQARTFARQLILANLVPANAVADALHIAAAATGGIDFLLTWNCAHIANASIRPRLESWFRARSITPPTICTPEELMGN
jgi:hypothetical protein